MGDDVVQLARDPAALGVDGGVRLDGQDLGLELEGGDVLVACARRPAPGPSGSPTKRSRVGTMLDAESEGSVRTATATPTDSTTVPTTRIDRRPVGADRERREDHGEEDADLVRRLEDQ